jgi:alkaline phosphatase
MPHAIDTGVNRLNDMVNHALPVLSENNDNGFFLLIEGSEIDWCGHSNDIACAMHEMHDFALTLETVKNYIDNHPDTIMVVTADHSTGGLTIGANTKYVWYPAALKGVKGSLGELAKVALNTKDWEEFGEDYLGLSLNKDEVKSLKKARRKGEDELFTAIGKIIDTHSNTGWTTGGHTAIDVQVFAYGKGANHFVGSHDNVDLPKILFEMMESNER